MDLFDAIYERKSIRRFKQTPVSEEDINKILDAGQMGAQRRTIPSPGAFWSFRTGRLAGDGAKPCGP